MTLEEDLQIFFREHPKKVVIIGVGNPIRADDGVGVKIINKLQALELENVLLLNSETVPEAFIDNVVEFNPSHVLILDAANFQGSYGEARLIPIDKIGGATVSTHNLPLTIFATYLQQTLNTKVILLGIQPKIIEFGAAMSSKVHESAEEIVEILHRILGRIVYQ
jgi:hydrogenase 3 maturation protease